MAKVKSEARGPAWGERWLGALERRAAWLAVLFVVIGTARIAAVYPVYNHTVDEPAHIACGMEWLDKGTYRLEDQHPPLSRVAAALGPKLAGAHSWGRNTIYNEGAAILYVGDQYMKMLTLARAGILPFFWLASLGVWFWARRGAGAGEAALAVLLFTLTPAVLAHAGLATTDMALTAGFACSVAALLGWLERPSMGSAALFGAAVGAMVLSKLSSIVFFPVAVLGLVVLMRPKVDWKTLGVAAGVGALVIWAGYRFSFGASPWGFAVPAPELFSGIMSVKKHNAEGHPSYLLGALSRTGWSHYYFVVLAVKTPLPLLALAGLGVWLGWKQKTAARQAGLAVVAGILVVGVFSSINIGVRHVLPVYAAFAVLGAGALVWLLKGRFEWAGALMVVLLVGGGAMAHPDYLPYTNLLAGAEPEKVLADSDLDWGQDMLRLSARLRELGVQEVAFSPFIAAHLERVHGFPRITASDPVNPSPGWNAVSITVLKTARMGLGFEEPGAALWPERFKASERVGSGVLLYYFPPQMFGQGGR